MKGMGTIAQFTMKAFFMDAHLAVSKKEEIFGMGLQRRFNIIKAAIGKVINTSLEREAEAVQLIPEITPYLPQNDTEVIDNITVARTGGILSKETAVEINPLVEDPETEMERLKDDTTNQMTGFEV
jgi:SPP1 family phage portal protein